MEANSLKIAARISIIYLSILLIGAILFYKQRMLFGDAPWITFFIINKHSLFIQEHRYGSFITQIFPLLSSLLHAPLSFILLLYSFSFNFFYLATGYILYRIRAYHLVVLLALYFSLICSSSYFWTNNEVHQGITWLFLLFGFLFQNEQKKIKPVYSILTCLTLGFLAIFSHPMVILAGGFLWVYFLLEQNRAPFTSKRIIIYTLIICSIIGVKFYFSVHGWYDGNVLEHITKASGQQVLSSLYSHTAVQFAVNSMHNYWLLPILLIVGIFSLLKERKYLMIIWVILCCIGYTILISLAYESTSLAFYIESEWMPLAIIVAISVVYYMVPQINSTTTTVLFILIFSVRIMYILAALPDFTNRLTVIKVLISGMKKNNITKAVIKRHEAQSLLEEKLIMSWGLPVETLFMSELEGERPSLSAVQIYEADIPGKLAQNNKDFMTHFFTIPEQDINRYYFHYDTIQPYRIVSYEMLYQGK